MITILFKDTKQVVTPTIFPDGTSQVWKIDGSQYEHQYVSLLWQYESDAEFFQLVQLKDLLHNEFMASIDKVYVPYYPYARQDKNISNESTFALVPFTRILASEFFNVVTLDIHNPNFKHFRHGQLSNKTIEPFIEKAINHFKPEVIVYPDAGAFDRYDDLIYMHFKEKGLESPTTITLDKVRDQSTGKLLSLKINEEHSDMDWVYSQQIHSNIPRLLIVDDICDGGRTFINASMFLHQKFKCNVGLYVTHGIYSQGFDPLIDGGITSFYTTNSLPRNIVGENVYDVMEVL